MTSGTPFGPRSAVILPSRRRWPRRAGSALAVLILLLLVVPFTARRATDLLWYHQLGFGRVFLLKIAAQWVLALPAGIIAFIVLVVNGGIALGHLDIRTSPATNVARSVRSVPQDLIGRLAQASMIPASALVALVLAFASASEWRSLVLWYYGTPFGIADPIFGRDVAYYVFSLPMLENALAYAAWTLGLALVAIAVPIYFALGDLAPRGWRVRVDSRPRVHIGVLSAALLLIWGWKMLLIDVPSILFEPHVPLQGASYTDLSVRVPALRLMGVLAIVAGVVVLWGAWRGRLVRSAALAVGGYLALYLLIVGITPALFQRLVVQPNELAREAPQIQHYIDATRRAWGIDSVERRELDSDVLLTMRMVEANHATISNVRLWDREPLLQTFGQLQSIRAYYDFRSIDDDRYKIAGELRQVLLSPRELDPAALPTRSFVNEHLTFTHGMGLTLGPSNQVTVEGLPMLWVKDLPPASSICVRVTRPQIYFGELAGDFILAPTRQREFDYPAAEGDSAVYSTYAGEDGVAAGSFVRRLLFALRFKSLNILLASDLTPETRVLFHRNVLERAELTLPFLRFDADPYMVVSDSGRLKWILDGYTTTDHYPYSQPLSDGTNYMRNSVKAVIDAYDGNVRAYVSDSGDPMVRTLSRIYPGLLRPLSEMPADLRAHLKYPTDLFNVQTQLYATFHMTEPESFYHKEDQWQVPRAEKGNERDAYIRHIVMRLPGEREPEFILMRPFTPRQKDNLAAWIVARNDGAHYGRLIAYRFPRQSLVFGPAQIVNRINQNTDVSQQVTLWDQRGSQVIRGELLVIPIEGSLLYVQPLYLRAEGGKIPELKRVIVVYGDHVAMEATLEEGIQKLFGNGTPALGAAVAAVPAVRNGADEGAADLARQALGHFERARAAQRADDWATYGLEIQRLGDVLRRLREQAEKRKR